MSKAGPKSFAVILGQCDDGQLLVELSTKLQTLNAALARHAEHFNTARGSLTLKLSLAVDSKGTTAIVADVAVKEPKTVRPGSIFWLDAANNLENKNPRQLEMPLRDVNANRETRDVETDDRDVKGV